jgi:hypothetical protein
MNKPTIALFLLFYFTLLTYALAQKNYGKIVDQEGKPIPYASIQSIKTSRGLTSNEEGFFSVLYKEHDKFFAISAIGFERKQVEFNLIDTLQTISLIQKVRDLEEIYIFTDSTLYNIINAAYRQIPVNYSTIPFSLDGYFSESSFSEDDSLLYLAEATLRVSQSGYHKIFEKGQVEVLKSRAVKNPEKDKIDNVYYFGGAFTAIESDPVKFRAEFLDPQNFNKKYTYSLEKIESIGDDEVFVIGFKSKESKKNTSGRLWIDKKTKAYWYIEREMTRDGSVNLSKIAHKSSIRKIKYRTVGEKWFLEFIKVSGSNYNKERKTDIKYQLNYFTTNVDTTARSHSARNSELNYLDILSETKINTDKAFFENSEIYEKEPEIQKQIDAMESQGSTTENNTLKLWLLKRRVRLRTEVSIGYISENGIRASTDVEAFNTRFTKEEITRSFAFTPILATSLRYAIKGDREVSLGLVNGLFRGKYNDFTRLSLVLRQYFDISSQRVNQYLFTDVEIGRETQSNFIKKATGSTNFGTSFKFRSDWVNLSTASRTNLWSAGAGYGLRKKKYLYFCHFSYSQALNQKHYFRATETKRLFPRRTNLLANDNYGLKTQIPKLTIEIGLKTHF